MVNQNIFWEHARSLKIQLRTITLNYSQLLSKAGEKVVARGEEGKCKSQCLASQTFYRRRHQVDAKVVSKLSKYTIIATKQTIPRNLRVKSNNRFSLEHLKFILQQLSWPDLFFKDNPESCAKTATSHLS